MTALLVALAGGLGAVARLILDGMLRSWFRDRYPATLIINVTGSLLLGLVTGLVSASVVPGTWALVVGTGFLGGYTTFSTAAVETVRMVTERRWAAAVIGGLGMLVLSVLAAALGLAVGLVVGTAARLG